MLMAAIFFTNLWYTVFEEGKLQRTVGGVVEELLAENSIKISVRIILSSTNKWYFNPYAKNCFNTC